MSLPVNLVLMLLGFGLLYLGGEWVVSAASALARQRGVSSLVIGLTVVSLGTTTPELCVSLLATFRGTRDLAVGNVVGSVIFNLLAVLGSAALIRALPVATSLRQRELPRLLLVSLGVWAIASSGHLPWQAAPALLLTLVFCIYSDIEYSRCRSSSPSGVAEETGATAPEPAGLRFGQLLLGIGMLVLGSQSLVQGATAIARLLGVRETLIGLTIVSVGTSTPELVTATLAALRGQGELALGNVLGSSLLNQLLILGSCALVSAPAGLSLDTQLVHRDLPVMVLVVITCCGMAFTGHRFSRQEGVALSTLYGLYLIEQIATVTTPDLSALIRDAVILILLPLLWIGLITRGLLFWQGQRQS